MSTLYIRNVPDDVAAGLGELAAREGLSVSAFAVRELTEAAARAGNERLLGELPDHGVDAAELVQDLDAGRAGR